jgi:hypothetical protein
VVRMHSSVQSLAPDERWNEKLLFIIWQQSPIQFRNSEKGLSPLYLKKSILSNCAKIHISIFLSYFNELRYIKLR